MAPPAGTARTSTVDKDELAKFETTAAAWWDPHGEFGPLHRLNPVRLAFIRDRVCGHFGRDPAAPAPLAGLRIVDIGCGGGLSCEPMARLGAAVTGIDAAAGNVEVARHHAHQSALEIDYRHATAEELAAAGARFDVVVSLEVVEHVADLRGFLAACAELLEPGGALVLATLNRTAKAFAFAIVGAEYLLGWLPRGTHDWRKFVRPSELASALRPHGVEVRDLVGVSYDPLADGWGTSRDLGVNYMVFAIKAGGA